MIHPPPINSKNRLKAFCEVGYAHFRPNVFAAGKRTSVEVLVRVGLHQSRVKGCWGPSKNLDWAL